MAGNRIPRVHPGDIISAEWMNNILDKIEDVLPWYCEHCGGAAAPSTYKCANCGAPRTIREVPDGK